MERFGERAIMPRRARVHVRAYIVLLSFIWCARRPFKLYADKTAQSSSQWIKLLIIPFYQGVFCG